MSQNGSDKRQGAGSAQAYQTPAPAGYHPAWGEFRPWEGRVAPVTPPSLLPYPQLGPPVAGPYGLPGAWYGAGFWQLPGTGPYWAAGPAGGWAVPGPPLGIHAGPGLPPAGALHRQYSQKTESRDGRPEVTAQPYQWQPPVDLYEFDDCWVIKVEVPGSKEDELSLTWEDGALLIAGEVADADRKRAYYRERRVGEFARRILIPENVDTENTEAAYRHGVLEITIPKPRDKKL